MTGARRRSYARSGLLACLAVLVAGPVMSVLLPYEGAIEMQGRVESIEPARAVTAAETSRVTEIAVADGGRVTAGDLLFVLRSDPVEREYALVVGQLDALAPQIEALAALTAREVTGDIATAAAEESALRDLPERFASQRLQLIDNAAETTARLAATADEDAALALQLAALGDEIALQQDRLDHAAALAEADLTTRQALQTERQRLASLQATRAQIEAGQARLQNQRAALAGEAERRRQQWRDQAFQELQRLRDRRAELTARQMLLVDRLTALSVLAPIDGVVEYRGLGGQGDMVPAGAVLAMVNPDGAAFQVRAEVPAARASQVRPGQQTRIRVLGQRALLHGKVTQVALRHRNAEGGETSAVEAVVALEPFAPGDASAVLGAGMPIQAYVTRPRRSLWHYLAEPLAGLSLRAFPQT